MRPIKRLARGEHVRDRDARGSWRPVTPWRVGRRTDANERGDTLLEVLFALVILSIATVALLIAFATSISASATHRSAATLDTVIRSASQQAISQFQQQTSPLYKSCATLSDYTTAQPTGNAPVFTLPTGYTAYVSAVQWWNGTTFVPSGSPGCIANAPEWITITIKKLKGVWSHVPLFVNDLSQWAWE